MNELASTIRKHLAALAGEYSQRLQEIEDTRSMRKSSTHARPTSDAQPYSRFGRERKHCSGRSEAATRLRLR